MLHTQGRYNHLSPDGPAMIHLPHDDESNGVSEQVRVCTVVDRRTMLSCGLFTSSPLLVTIAPPLSNNPASLPPKRHDSRVGTVLA